MTSPEPLDSAVSGYEYEMHVLVGIQLGIRFRSGGADGMKSALVRILGAFEK